MEPTNTSPVNAQQFKWPTTLYHYTTAAGLQGIVQTGAIWASELRFLNDARELQYGVDLLVARLKALVSQREADLDVLKIVDVLTTHRMMRYFCVSCFCENGDVLSQWRGYASSCGYAVGFNVELCQFPGWSTPFFPVAYGGTATGILVDKWASKAADKFLNVFDDRVKTAKESGDIGKAISELIEEFGTETVAEMEAVAVQLKDPAFAEEREWRIVAETHPQATEDRTMLFRGGPLGPTPYIALPLVPRGEPLPIRRIVVGPGPNSSMRVDAARYLLWSVGLTDVEVVASSVPYRP